MSTARARWRWMTSSTVNYVEHPGPPVEVTVEKHGYDVEWLNPATGESLDQKKYNGEHFTGQPPDSSHPWVLYIAREGHKESMAKSYKFESRPRAGAGDRDRREERFRSRSPGRPATRCRRASRRSSR